MSVGFVKMCNRAAALLRRPAVRRRLQTELSALAHPALSYEELLAFFIDFGSFKAILLHMEGSTEASHQEVDVETAARLAIDILPQLAPDNPGLLYTVAAMTKYAIPGPYAPAKTARACFLAMVPAALDFARQQGSDFFTVLCGYELASDIGAWVAESAVQPDLPPPSTVLGWLQQAEAAHRRCKALLPKLWTNELDGSKPMAVLAKASLQQMQQNGDRWRGFTPAEQQELNTASKDYEEMCKDPDSMKKQLACSNCGKWALQLRVCRACRKTQYCS